MMSYSGHGDVDYVRLNERNQIISKNADRARFFKWVSHRNAILYMNTYRLGVPDPYHHPKSGKNQPCHNTLMSHALRKKCEQYNSSTVWCFVCLPIPSSVCLMNTISTSSSHPDLTTSQVLVFSLGFGGLDAFGPCLHF